MSPGAVRLTVRRRLLLQVHARTRHQGLLDQGRLLDAADGVVAEEPGKRRREAAGGHIRLGRRHVGQHARSRRALDERQQFDRARPAEVIPLPHQGRAAEEVGCFRKREDSSTGDCRSPVAFPVSDAAIGWGVTVTSLCTTRFSRWNFPKRHYAFVNFHQSTCTKVWYNVGVSHGHARRDTCEA